MPGFLAKLDRFTIGLIVSVGAGILVPCSGVWDTVFSRLSDAAIVLLFFLYGAKLSRRSVWEGVMHWRLQGLVAASTFVIFPLLGMVSMPLWNSVLGPDLCMGMLYVCMLPSTVQSSIAFTSMAGGNVAAAICSAGGVPHPLAGGAGVVPRRGRGRGFFHFPEHLLYYSGAFCGRPVRPALDWQMGSHAPEPHFLDRPQHHLAGYLHGIQPCDD